MQPNRELGAWLIGHRREIEGEMTARLGPAAPRVSGPETEALRRFRTFASAALMRGEAPAPALDGLRPNERRVMALLGSWTDAAAQLAGARGGEVRRLLAPLLDDFRQSLRRSTASRASKGAPRAARRVVSAAIDRVVDAFLAVDAIEGRIVDANPAAGALLGVARDALLGIELMSFVPQPQQAAWWTQLDSIAEGEEAQRFDARLHDASGIEMPVEVSTTRFATRGRTLALVLMRPVLSNGAVRGGDGAPAR